MFFHKLQWICILIENASNFGTIRQNFKNLHYFCCWSNWRLLKAMVFLIFDIVLVSNPSFFSDLVGKLPFSNLNYSSPLKYFCVLLPFSDLSPSIAWLWFNKKFRENLLILLKWKFSFSIFFFLNWKKFWPTVYKVVFCFFFERYSFKTFD